MSKYTSRVVRDTEEPPKLPEFCDVADCNSFYPGNDKPSTRGLADVIITTATGEKVARCAYHYDRELYRMRRGRHSPMMDGAVDLTLDMVRKHWARIDADAKVLAAKREAIP